MTDDLALLAKILADPRWQVRRPPAAGYEGSAWEYERERVRSAEEFDRWLATPGGRQQASYLDGALAGYRLGIDHGIRAAALLSDAQLTWVLGELQAEVERRRGTGVRTALPSRPRVPRG